MNTKQSSVKFQLTKGFIKGGPHISKKRKTFFEDLKEKNSILKFFDEVGTSDIHRYDVTTRNGFMKELLIRIKKVDVTGLGSQLAFFFLLSLFPLLIFLITLLPFLNLDQGQIFEFIRDFAPGSVSLLIEETLSDILRQRNGGLLSIGVIGTMWSASKGMNALTRALNRSYFTEETRSFLITRGMSIVFTLMMIVVVIIALLLPIFGRLIGAMMFTYLGFEGDFLEVWNQLRWMLPPILIFFVFSVIYWIVPNLKLNIKTVIPGAIFSTLGWILTSVAFSYYVSSFGNYSGTYGSIGAIIVLMMWLYFSAIILIIGGQINAVYMERLLAIAAKEKSNAVSR